MSVSGISYFFLPNLFDELNLHEGTVVKVDFEKGDVLIEELAILLEVVVFLSQL